MIIIRKNTLSPCPRIRRWPLSFCLFFILNLNGPRYQTLNAIPILQEYGWISEPLSPPSSQFRYPRSSCSVTQYATAYSMSTQGMSPFSFILNCADLSWIVLTYLELCWLILNCVDSSWIILNYLEWSWIVFNHLESSWIILNHLESSWIILNHLESSWMILNCLEWSWMILHDLEWSLIIFNYL